MADNGAPLAAELTRIIECSYPASLSHLAGVLADSHVPSIRTCIADRSPCATQKLVSIVYNALPLASYTLRILHQLCQAAEFREQLLLLKPALLDALLTKANTSQQDFDDYAATCLLLLSYPLPASVPLPSSAQEFFLRVFQKSIQKPCVETLKPVYRMLNGACSRLFSLLPRETQQQFDQQLRHILKSSDVGKDAMLLLWCFGIVLLVEYPNAVSSQHKSSSTYKTASGQKLFLGTTSLYRTITLASLSVIWALKGGVGGSDEEATEGIRIASRVLRVIDQDVRENWPKSDARARGTFLKLVEKTERLDTESAIFFEAVGYQALILGPNGIQSETATQYQSCLARTISLAHGHDLTESLSDSLPAFADHLQPDTIQSIYSGALDACMSKPSFRQRTFLITLMEILATALCTSETLRRNSVLAISSTQHKLRAFLRVKVEHQRTPCSTYAAAQHQRLLSATIATLVMTAATVHTGEAVLPPILVLALIEKQRNLPSDGGSCSHPVPPLDRSHVSLFQQASTPYTGQHLQDWRTRLNSELESQNHYQRDMVLRSVAQICQDLESRCSTVEEPLRREQNKTRGLEEKVAELSNQVSTLQSRISDDDLHLQGLDDEKELLEQENRALSEANKRLTLRIDNLKCEHAEANERAEEALKNVQQIRSAKESELQSTILQRGEENRAYTAQLQELSRTISDMKIAHEVKEDALRTLNQQCTQLQNRLSDTEQQLHDARVTSSKQAGELANLQTRSFDVESQLRGTEEELELTASRLKSLQISHQEMKQSSEDMMKRAEVEHNSNMEAAAARAQEEHSKLHKQLRSAQEETLRLQNTYDNTLRECQVLQASISSLQARTQELTELCSEQEEELHELRTLRRNVLASMGLGTQKPLAMRSASRSQESNIDPQPPHESHEPQVRKLALSTSDAVPKASPSIKGTADAAEDAVVDVSFASFGGQSFQDSDRNPKRPKPRPFFRVPAVQTPFTQKPNLPSKTLSKRLSPNKRCVLRQVSPNRRHTTVGFTVGEKSETQGIHNRSERLRRGSLEDFEPTDFDMEEDFVAGTPLTPGNYLAGTGRVPDDDETATEL
ncbi:hypothetical protein NX059_005675 [Plenodomus lindquistii]|nr:hypothetical protein NX059_005675 [Plenodomus lindquistii]